MHHDLNQYFLEQMARTKPATHEAINSMIEYRRAATWAKMDPALAELEQSKLQSKVGQSILYYMQVDAPTNGVANHTMHICQVWSDEFAQLNQDLHDYYYDPLGETDFPRFVHRAHKDK
jgi:hypothetical protein